MVRRGIRALLQAKGFEIIAEAGHGADAVRLVADLQPDVLVMDINMPVMNGIEATREIIKSGSPTKILALSASDPTSAYEMLAAGAKTFVTKARAFEDLPPAIEQLVASERE